MVADSNPAELRRGLAFGVAAFAVWGLAPVYWKLLGHVDPWETVAHRTVWSSLFMLVVLAATGTVRSGARALAETPGAGWRLALSAILIAANWLLYIIAVTSGRILEASLGYFANPLVSVALGVLFFGERLTRRRQAAIAVASAGVALLAWRVGSLPWIALCLAFSFAFYGLLRKTVPVRGAVGLAFETALLSPLCLGFLLWREGHGGGAFGFDHPRDALLLAATGILTALPLWWFAEATRRLPLSTIGMLQYLAPTLQFLLAVLVYRETFGATRLAAFAMIWAACLLFSWPSRARRPTAAADEVPR